MHGYFSLISRTNRLRSSSPTSGVQVIGPSSGTDPDITFALPLVANDVPFLPTVTTTRFHPPRPSASRPDRVTLFFRPNPTDHTPVDLAGTRQSNTSSHGPKFFSVESSALPTALAT